MYVCSTWIGQQRSVCSRNVATASPQQHVTFISNERPLSATFKHLGRRNRDAVLLCAYGPQDHPTSLMTHALCYTYIYIYIYIDTMHACTSICVYVCIDSYVPGTYMNTNTLPSEASILQARWAHP